MTQHVARKRDKEGNRFGFLSMLDVKDREETCKRLSAIRLGDCRLRFNVARFVLEEGEIGGEGEAPGRRLRGRGTGNGVDKVGDVGNDAGKVGGGVNGSSNPWCVSGRSFKETLLGEKKDSQAVRSLNISNNIKAFESVHGRAMLIRMDNLKELRELKCTMKDLGMPGGKVQYLGGVSALITFKERSEAVKAMDIGMKAGHSFSQISLWEGQSVGFERLAWLKVHGIPLHILSNSVIDSVGGLFGKIVHKAERSESDSDLSFEFVGVLVGEGRRISDEVTIGWNDRKYRVWVLEEMGDWVPEFDDPCSEDDFGAASGTVGPEIQPEEAIGEEGDGYNFLGFNEGNKSELLEENLKEGGYENSNNNISSFSSGNSVGKKRKKYKKKKRLGRPNMENSKCLEQSSSMERPAKGKRARCSPDIFGLNQFIFDSEKAVAANNEKDGQVEGAEGGAVGFNAIVPDLNDNPVGMGASPDAVIEASAAAGGVGSSRVRTGRGSEIEATMELGEKIGIDLSNFEGLIMETINQEGLQRGLL